MPLKSMAFFWLSFVWSASLVIAATPAGVPEAILREVLVPEDLPPGDYQLVHTWEAESLGHRIGRSVSDSQAGQGQAWEVRIYEDPPMNHMVYGPYVAIPPGNYLAFFRMKLLEEGGGGSVATIDASVDFGRDTLNIRNVSEADLALGRYVQVPLGFTYRQGRLECRVFWKGDTSLRVDRITLFRVDKAEPKFFQPRRAPKPTPSGLPRDLAYRSEPRPFPELFPRSQPPASTLLTFDLTRLPIDEQLLALTLQGLVNREQPQLYLLMHATDTFWLQWMTEKGWIQRTETVATLEALIQRFRSQLQGMVIFDPRLPASKNVGTMIAAVEDGVLVSPRLARKLDLPVLVDLRGRWQKDVEAYRWAFENLWDRLNHHVLACSWPDHVGLRDYLVQHKVFIFWIAGPLDGAEAHASPDEEVRLMEELLAEMPVNIPVMSYPWAGEDIGIGEGPGVTLFSAFGKYLVGSINTTNLSVHSGIRIPRLDQQPAPVPPLEQDKVYLAFIISDGDNLPVLTVNNFPQLWRSDVRGTLPIGWTISPAALMLIPDIVDYYYTTATERDRFLGAVSGLGYMYPDHYAERFKEEDRRRIFDEFLEQTGAAMQKMGLEEIWIMGVSDPRLIRRYAEKIPSLKAIFPDYGRRVASYAEATYPTVRNVPVFHAVTGWSRDLSREEQIANVVSQVRAITPQERPAFLHLFVLNWFADLPMLREILQRLGPEYVAVRPDQLAALYRQRIRQQQMLVRKPGFLPVLESQSLLFELLLHNATDQEQRVAIQDLEGLTRGTVDPPHLTLPSGQGGSLVISGIPSGDQVRLKLGWTTDSRWEAIPLRRIPVSELMEPVSDEGALRFAAQFEAENLPHRSGEATADPKASGGEVWEARREKAKPGFIVYGPYMPLEAGNYLALFRLKRLSAGDGVVATLDTCVGGGEPVTASRQVHAQELPVGQYRSFPVEVAHPGGAIETRVIWTGNADLAVDQIILWRLVRP